MIRDRATGQESPGLERQLRTFIGVGKQPPRAQLTGNLRQIALRIELRTERAIKPRVVQPVPDEIAERTAVGLASGLHRHRHRAAPD